mmetsp:Transcript_85127/g.150567  ORF Transcript_85127/g.150567 Transcript_85127/m.150567 type:complete len:465 (-) Transcript_85127:278-1672(-)
MLVQVLCATLLASLTRAAPCTAPDANTIRMTVIWDLCLDQPVSGTGDVRLLDCSGAASQQWLYVEESRRISPVGDPSKCLDADNSPGTVLQLQDCDSSESQSWYVSKDYGVIKTWKMQAYTMTFDAASATAGGTRVVLWDSTECWTQSLAYYGGVYSPDNTALGNEMKLDLLDAIAHLDRDQLGCPSQLQTPVLPSVSGFQPSCLSQDQFGWPRFESKAELQANLPWRNYFMQVYGVVPNDGYPICTFGFWSINITAFTAAGLSTQFVPITDRILPQLYFWEQGQLFQNRAVGFDGNELNWINGYAIFHSYRLRQYTASNTWIEVTHTGSGATGEDVGMWLFYAPGSGVWYNTGNLIAFATHEEASWALCGQHCSTHFNASCDNMIAQCGRDQGYDTVQFMFTFAYSSAAYFELLATDFVGKYTCGVNSSGILNQTFWASGWRASRPCRCNNAVQNEQLNCDLE